MYIVFANLKFEFAFLDARSPQESRKEHQIETRQGDGNQEVEH